MSLFTRAFLGLTVGGALLWIALSQVDTTGALSALEKASIAPLIASLATYWCAVGLRTVRWRKLLSGVAPLSFVQIAQCLIVGYAVNNILPARLGELFRVDFLRRQYGVARSAGLGSIVVERIADGLIAIALLVVGLGFSDFKSEHSVLVTAAVLAAAGAGTTLIALYFALSKRHLLPARLSWLASRLEILTNVITSIGWLQLASITYLSIVIWSFEALSIWLIVWAFGVSLTVFELCLVFGSAALSTLLPTAPGYVGSMQMAFVLSFSAIGLNTLSGLLSATVTQVLLFGSITVAGLLLLFAKHLQGLLVSLARDES